MSLFWGILLAAGQGVRYAQRTAGADKLLAVLPTKQTVIETSATALAAHTDYTLAITAPNHPQRFELLQRSELEVMEDKRCRQGMGISLALAAQHLRQRALHHPPPKGVMVALADMPSIQPSSYQAVAQALSHAAIAAPVYQGKRGHPVGFSWALIDALSECEGDQGARQLLQQQGFHSILTNDAGVIHDIDLPQHLPTS